MPSCPSDTLGLIRDTIAYLKAEIGSPIFASQETADFFRKKLEKPSSIKSEASPKKEKKFTAETKEEQRNGKDREDFTQRWTEADKTFLSKNEASSKKDQDFIIETPQRLTESKEIVANKVQIEEKKIKPTQELHKQLETRPKPKEDTPLPKSSSNLSAPVSFTEVRKLFSSLFPQFPVIDSIPSDEIAVKIAERWKTKNKAAPISILAWQEPKEQRVLLEQIAKALDAVFFTAQVIEAEPIEKEKQWEAFLSVPDLEVVIVCDYTLWQMKHLMALYKENPIQESRTLGAVPLFLLPDLSLYLKDPLLKRSLWKALCQKISS